MELNCRSVLSINNFCYATTWLCLKTVSDYSFLYKTIHILFFVVGVTLCWNEGFIVSLTCSYDLWLIFSSVNLGRWFLPDLLICDFHCLCRCVLILFILKISFEWVYLILVCLVVVKDFTGDSMNSILDGLVVI